MEQKFLLPMARNIVTGQTQKMQDLTGTRLTTQQRFIAQEMAERLAKDLSRRTGQSWVAVVKEYSATFRRNPA